MIYDHDTYTTFMYVSSMFNEVDFVPGLGVC